MRNLKETYSIGSLKPILEKEGLRGLYRGYNITATCVPLFNMVYMPLYETLKKKFVEWYGFEEGSWLLYQSTATLAGAICNVLSNPLWLVRTRMQAEAFRTIS